MKSSASVTSPCITFLTDFGLRDTFVGQMKGVAYGINPAVRLVDLTHAIPPQNICRGAYVWQDAVWAFPAGSIHVGVVDPGVGSKRSLIAAEIGGHFFVCPDNGLISVIVSRQTPARVVQLDNSDWWRPNPSKTFHGRDILTPVAAHLSLGHNLSELGSLKTTPLVTLNLPAVVRGRASISGHVIDIDRFGNLITNIDLAEISCDPQTVKVGLGAFTIEGLSACYADVNSGDAIALQGSHGRLEIAIREGNAAKEFQVKCGRPVVVRWQGSNE